MHMKCSLIIILCIYECVCLYVYVCICIPLHQTEHAMRNAWCANIHTYIYIYIYIMYIITRATYQQPQISARFFFLFFANN